MQKIITLFVMALVFIAGSHSQVFAQQEVQWNGYLQYRFSENYSDKHDFSIRRAKLWMKRQLPFQSNRWGFKIQSIFSDKQHFGLQLQDAFLDYTVDNFTLNAGQFVPDFSLQRKQPDYLIPLTERAEVIKALIPTAETMARDIGFEVNYSGYIAGISAGFFNGNGANSLSEQKNFLFIHRGILRFANHLNNLQVGYSFSYRKDNNLQFSRLLGSSIEFSGKDLRYGFDLRFETPRFEFQAEFLEAYLQGNRAWGYYALADYQITTRHLAILSVEQLDDLNPSTIDRPWFILGYSYQLKRNDIKFTTENRFQFTINKMYSLTTLQIQYFFNQ